MVKARIEAREYRVGESTPRWRLLLVDDHALFREGLASLFAYEADLEVVGQAGDGDSALAQVRQLRPDIVLMDIDLPGADGIVVTRQLKAEFPETVVAMLTVHDATDKLIEAVKAGAQGYLVKASVAWSCSISCAGSHAAKQRSADAWRREFWRSFVARLRAPSKPTSLSNNSRRASSKYWSWWRPGYRTRR